MSARILVLGYGNPDRNDDGAGWAVVAALRADPPPGVALETAQQLEVEMAERIAELDCAVFVDAATPDLPEPLVVEEISAAWRPHATTHHLAPGDLLALAETLYGKRPRAVLVKLRGGDFNFGARLSPETRAAADEAARRIRALVSAQTAGDSPAGSSLRGKRRGGAAEETAFVEMTEQRGQPKRAENGKRPKRDDQEIHHGGVRRRAEHRRAGETHPGQINDLRAEQAGLPHAVARVQDREMCDCLRPHHERHIEQPWHRRTRKQGERPDSQRPDSRGERQIDLSQARLRTKALGARGPGRHLHG